ncbi:hypothetical protein [Pseudomonas sp. NMI4491_12]|uniref:hypothetical protein n=1 Tax=Pseudomonas sp. NMI4491_12 TaxID=2903146 RepID=UPI001E5DD20A|nr:hypothetical protein [Pseudomonas sp. NMI4491_12]MCE0968503.1 hypothetical protein [Pseudomonas sp. NMI4491_12]
MTKVTSYDLDKILAIEQIRHYQHLKQAAAGSGDKVEYRRCADQVEIIITEYGLRQSEDGTYE